MVHRTNEDIGSAHGKCRGNGVRRGDAAGGSYAQWLLVSVFTLNAVSQRYHRGQQAHGGAVVGVPTTVRLGGEVLGDWDLPGEARLRFRDVAAGDELLQERLWRR